MFRDEVEPNGWKRISISALVMRAIHDIDESSAEQLDVLLTDLLCAAWGDEAALNQ